jgi:fatty acid desaturase
MDALSTRDETDDAERLRRFGEEIDAIKARVEAEVGPDDIAYVRRLDRFSRTMEVIGRVLIHVSPEPLSFGAGVVALWIHKQLQATEIGHTVLHGAYDRIEGRGRFDSKRWWWALPIDEESWRYGHNVRHHGATNVAGKDADIHFGPVRLTEQTAHRPEHRFQLLFALAVLFPNFAFTMNLHFTGLNDLYWDNGRPEKLDFLPDRSPASRRLAWTRALRKYVPYYALEYGLYPALAGPFFWKVLLGNWLSDTMRDVYSAATIFCGHVGERTKSYPAGARPRGRGEWYAMQVEASNDFEVPRWVSILCGGLDRQIEHHLFPKLAPERLRAIAPEVRAACERHGVEYRSAGWPETLRSALAWIDALAKERGGPAAGARAAIEAMA